MINIPVESQHGLLFGLLKSLDLGAESCDGMVVDKAVRLGGDTATPRVTSIERCLIAVLGRENLTDVGMLMMAGCVFYMLRAKKASEIIRCTRYSPSH